LAIPAGIGADESARMRATNRRRVTRANSKNVQLRQNEICERPSRTEFLQRGGNESRRLAQVVAQKAGKERRDREILRCRWDDAIHIGQPLSAASCPGLLLQRELAKNNASSNSVNDLRHSRIKDVAESGAVGLESDQNGLDPDLDRLLEA